MSDENKPEPVAATPTALSPGDPSTTTEQLVRRWVSENLSHGRIARDVELWNELQTALPTLVSLLETK